MGFGFGGDFQRFDEDFQHFGRDAAFAARQVFQFFVRIGNTVAAHNGLNRLGEQLPSGIQIGGQRGGVGFELVQTAQVGGETQHGIAYAYAHIAQDGAVGQVALPTGNRQFFGQKAQYGVGHAKVAFRVFKVDGVDFVRHGGRANFARFDFLFEVTQ